MITAEYHPFPSIRPTHAETSAGDLAACQDLGAVDLVEALEPRRLVRHRADQGVVDALARADVADHRRAGMQPEAGAKARST